MTEFQPFYAGRVWSVMGATVRVLAKDRPGCRPVSAGSGCPTGVDFPECGRPVSAFIEQIGALLRNDHHESCCGIVYGDDLDNPRLIKIYDPNNLGSSCGSSKNPPGPGWVMSRETP